MFQHYYFLSYITGKLSDIHGMHGLLIDAAPFIVALHMIGVILFIFILQTQTETMSLHMTAHKFPAQ